jgi:hypothetical protein
MTAVIFGSPITRDQFAEFNASYVDKCQRAGKTGLLDYNAVKRGDRIVSLDFRDADAALACAMFFTPMTTPTMITEDLAEMIEDAINDIDDFRHDDPDGLDSAVENLTVVLRTVREARGDD